MFVRFFFLFSNTSECAAAARSAIEMTETNEIIVNIHET